MMPSSVVLSTKCLLPNGKVKPRRLVIEAGIIKSITKIGLAECDMSGILCPGFIDLQVNGAGSVLFNDAPDISSIETIASVLKRYGTTSWLPTLVTDTAEQMQKAADAVAQAMLRPELGVVGIHFEGPHISEQKKGVHDADYIRPIAAAEMAIYQRTDIGAKLLTLAPEMVSSDDIQKLIDHDCVVSIGHSNANYDQCVDADEAGATVYTHLYNAMSGISGRQPGVIGAALNGFCYYGFIMDGIHVHPALARMAYRANSNMILVSDSMPPVGTDDEAFNWFGETILRDQDRLTDQDGRLAGALLTQDQALKNAISFLGLSISEAADLVCRNPAELLDIDDSVGLIREGCRANLVSLSKQHDVKQVWIDGIQQI